MGAGETPGELAPRLLCVSLGGLAAQSGEDVIRLGKSTGEGGVDRIEFPPGPVHVSPEPLVFVLDGIGFSLEPITIIERHPNPGDVALDRLEPLAGLTQGRRRRRRRHDREGVGL